MPRDKLRTVHVRSGIAVAVSAVVFGSAAAPSQASTIAYVNGNDGNTYVASPTGTDVHEVATGVSSPALSATGNLYALQGSQVDVYAPGIGAQTPFSIPATMPTQLTVAPFGNKVAWTDGTTLNVNTTVGVLNRSTGKVTTFANSTGPQWLGAQRLFRSEFDFSNPTSTSVAVYNGVSSRTVWTVAAQPVSDTLVLQYLPNPAHTQAAAVIAEFTLKGVFVGLAVFPINSTFGPAGDPLNGASCEVDAGDLNPQVNGLTFAWSPDGSAIAYASNSGISTVSIGTWNSNCSQIGSPQLVIPGGLEPSWGPSNRRNFPTP